jgi:hypothetical protein
MLATVAIKWFLLMVQLLLVRKALRTLMMHSRVAMRKLHFGMLLSPARKAMMAWTRLVRIVIRMPLFTMPLLLVTREVVILRMRARTFTRKLLSRVLCLLVRKGMGILMRLAGVGIRRLLFLGLFAHARKA